jgi:hypothetical protein
MITSSVGNISESEFVPNEDFFRDDADVTIVALLNNVVFTGEVEDTFYRAQTPQVEYIPGPVDVWGSNRTVSALGCTEEIQFCVSERCTKLGGLWQNADEAVIPLGLNAAQMATHNVLFEFARMARFFYLHFHLSGDYLIAKDHVYGDTHLSAQLDSDFWQTEVENLHNITMAVIQRAAVRFAAPPNIKVRDNILTKQFHRLPTTPEGRHLCQTQKIRSLQHDSFNVIGLTSIILAGLIIISCRYLLPVVAARIQLRTAQGTRQWQEWINNDLLQLHRAALEGAGVGPWTGLDNDVPVLVDPDQRIQFAKLHKRELSYD